MGLRWEWLAVTATFVVACGSDKEPPPFDPSCEANPDPHCDHPIDRVLVPRLRELGVPIRDASAEELCRRIAIDLVGRGPTADEMNACAGKTSGEIFDLFAAKPEYLREQRRQWGELYKYEIVNTVPEEIVHLDTLVGQLYAEEIDYAQYVTEAAMHPVLEHLHPADSWTTYVWNLYLGRPARQDEIDSMRPFTLAWGVRGYCSGMVWYNHYKAQIDGGADEATAIAEGNRVCRDVQKLEWGFNLCSCRPGFFSDGCVSDALGKRVEITEACADPNNYFTPANFFRASDRSPGPHACPDGIPRAECNDRLIDPQTNQPTLPFEPWQAPTPELSAQIRSVGDALIARGDFWEAGADRELHKLTGWWQSTFRHPDSDIPEVRTILADQLKATGSVRGVQRQIVTSLLYAQPAEAPVEVPGFEAMPPWIAGPTKLLAGEGWLVTAANSVGESASTCDYRAVSIGYYAQQFMDPTLLEQYTGTLDAVMFPGYSINSIVRLSGCNADAKRPEVSNIGLTFNQADIARALCAYGSGLPTAEAFPTAAASLIRQIWHRSPKSGEAEAMAGDMSACVAAGAATACEDDEAAVRWMCQRMIDSAEFGTY